MIDIDIRSNVKEVAGFLRFMSRKQVRYAIMVALSRTAKDGREAVVADIPKRFNVTKKWWLPKQPTGVKNKSATKAKLQSEVFTNAYFLPLQESGGIKLPHKSDGLLVPTDLTPKYGRRSGGAKKLLATKRILRHGGTASGSPIYTFNSGKKGIFRRRTKKRLPLDLLYNFIPACKIDKRFRFEDTMKKIVNMRFNVHFYEVLYQAIKRAKR